MNCSNVKTELACWTDSTGKATTIKIVTEFSYDAAGELIVYKTRYVNAADEVIEIPSSDTVTLGECCVACAPERLDGCAAGVPYKQLIYINGSDVTNKYINLETGAVSVTPPGGFALGACSEAPTSGSGGTPATDEEIATAGQTAFTLSGEPLAGVVWAFRNGVRLPNAAVTVSGSDATYVPAANNGGALLAGDRITFDYTK